MLITKIVYLLVLASRLIALEDPNHDPLLVSTTSGPVLGFLDVSTIPTAPLRKWLGVRFAQDTSGANRWRPPQPYTTGTVFNATEFGPACLQGRVNGGNGTSIQSEDCLRINLIAPVGAKDLPIYVYS